MVTEVLLNISVSCKILYDVLYKPSTVVQKGHPDVPVPSSYSFSLIPVDTNYEEMIITAKDETIGIFIVLNVVDELNIRMLWNCTVIAYRCRQHPLTNSFELSKDTL